MKNWPKAYFGQKFWETRIQNVLDSITKSKIFFLTEKPICDFLADKVRE